MIGNALNFCLSVPPPPFFCSHGIYVAAPSSKKTSRTSSLPAASAPLVNSATFSSLPSPLLRPSWHPVARILSELNTTMRGGNLKFEIARSVPFRPLGRFPRGSCWAYSRERGLGCGGRFTRGNFCLNRIIHSA